MREHSTQMICPRLKFLTYRAALRIMATLTLLILLAQSARPQTADTFNPNASSDVYSLALDQEGHILAGGFFTTISNQSRQYFARLNDSGTLLPNFSIGANSQIFTTAVQPDGKVLIGGWFNSVMGQTRVHLARLNQDGSLDLNFNPGASAGNPFPGVYSILLQEDGKILVGGSFTVLGGQTCTNIGRLHPDGSLDQTFTAHANNIVYPMALQPDGKIVLGGDFTTLGGQPRNYLGRLNSDGSIDLGFNPGAGSTVLALAVQANGDILVGGAFEGLGGASRRNLGRLNPAGTLDALFAPNPNGFVRSLAIQSDGKIVVGGAFNSIGGLSRSALARLNFNGSADTNFNAGANNVVFGVSLQDDGKVLVGGAFTSLGGVLRNRIGRLDNTVPAMNELLFDGESISWLRSGTGPQVWRTAFDYSTNGISWTPLGPGVGTESGWKLTGLALPVDASIRARGFVTGGRYNASTWFVEQTAGPAVIEPVTFLRQPQSRTVAPNSQVWFDVEVTGTPPIDFQWLKDGQIFLSGDGRQSSILTLSNITQTSAGDYSVVVSNISGSVTSEVATLIVPDPFFVNQPPDRTNNAGTQATFSGFSIGTAPIAYQWWKDGIRLTNGGNISGATSSSLSVNNVRGADAGEFWVTTSNAVGTATSRVARLTILDPTFAFQPASRIINLGQSTTLTVGVNGTAPLSYQWRKEGLDIPGATTSSLALANVQAIATGNYDVVVSNIFSTVTSLTASVTVNLAAPDSFSPFANGTVISSAIQPDGKTLFGGSFNTLGGQSRNMVGRSHPNGNVDSSFNPGANGNVQAFLIRPDGKILVGGPFTTVAGQTRRSLARLNYAGTLDASFTNQTAETAAIMAFVPQQDGKTLIAGSFLTLAGQPRLRLARLNADDTLDPHFDPGASDTVHTLAVLPNGRILAGGAFTKLAGQPAQFIGQILEDGTFDDTFHCDANGEVHTMVLQPDGKVIVGGTFSNLNGTARAFIGRLHPDGTTDLDFAPQANGIINSIALQTDGQIIVGGDFTTMNGQARTNLARLDKTGVLDPLFLPNTSQALSPPAVYSVALKSNGTILVTGSFASIAGVARNRIARLTNSEPATEILSFENSTLVWQRGGSSPEIWRTSFAISTSGTNWSELGAGLRITDGWQLEGVNIPGTAFLRARGFLQGGWHNGSSWFVEAIIGFTNSPPVILMADESFGVSSNQFGFKMSGPAGQTVVIEGSINLLDWLPLETNTFNTESIYFSDPMIAPSRFYRLRTD
jgi:uncharacterized delta-60 repeat protein